MVKVYATKYNLFIVYYIWRETALKSVGISYKNYIWKIKTDIQKNALCSKGCTYMRFSKGTPEFRKIKLSLSVPVPLQIGTRRISLCILRISTSDRKPGRLGLSPSWPTRRAVEKNYLITSGDMDWIYCCWHLRLAEPNSSDMLSPGHPRKTKIRGVGAE